MELPQFSHPFIPYRFSKGEIKNKKEGKGQKSKIAKMPEELVHTANTHNTKNTHTYRETHKPKPHLEV